LIPDNFIQASAQVFQFFCGFGITLFGCQPAAGIMTPDLRHYFFPADITFRQQDIESGPASFPVGFLPAKFLNMDTSGQVSQRRNPVFRPSLYKDITAVKIHADKGTVKLFQIHPHFYRA
jgi:hypothetical protein